MHFIRGACALLRPLAPGGHQRPCSLEGGVAGGTLFLQSFEAGGVGGVRAGFY